MFDQWFGAPRRVSDGLAPCPAVSGVVEERFKKGRASMRRMLQSVAFVGLIVLVAGVGCTGSSLSSSGCTHNPPFRSSPAWSPDGRKIACARGDAGVSSGEGVVMNGDGRR